MGVYRKIFMAIRKKQLAEENGTAYLEISVKVIERLEKRI